MAANYEEVARAMILGRIGREPETGRTSSGVMVCRLHIVNQAGPASRPVRVAAYIKGEFAKRCGFNLHRGDLIEVVGDIGPQRSGVGYQELLVTGEDVTLKQRAGQVAGAA